MNSFTKARAGINPLSLQSFIEIYVSFHLKNENMNIYTHLDREQKRLSVEKINSFIHEKQNLGQSKISQNKKITGSQHFKNAVNPLF